MNIQDWFKLVDFRITDSSNYGWNCFGVNAMSFESNLENYTVYVVFDTKTQEVYVMESYDWINSRAYRIMNPKYIQAYKDECASRNCNDNAIDEMKFIDLEVYEDFLEKTEKIISGEQYDTSVMVNLEIPEKYLNSAFREAHRLNITFNEYISRLLLDEIKLTNYELENALEEIK